jgi:Spy/CpxP family protein refolding chaperone
MLKLRKMAKSIISLLAVVWALILGGPGGAVLAAQGGRQRPLAGAALDDPSVTPVEIQRMFDAYALMQAQEQLRIGDDQFSQFLTRYKALQDVRRKTLQERTRLVNEMRRLLNRTPPDEAPIRERLKALEDLEARAAADVKKASDAIDQVLDIRQQAQFRVFEENMERRKLELVTRARQANRPKDE